MDAVETKDPDFPVAAIGHEHGPVRPEGGAVDPAELLGSPRFRQGLRSDGDHGNKLPFGRGACVGHPDDAADGVDRDREVSGAGRRFLVAGHGNRDREYQ
jgi:hypothetical protein